MGGGQPARLTGLGQRPATRGQRVEGGTEPAHILISAGRRQRGREGEDGVSVDADADPVGVVDAQRRSGLEGRVGGLSQRADRAAGAHSGGFGIGDLAQGTAADPLGHHDAAVALMHGVEHARQTGRLNLAEPQGVRKDVLYLVGGEGRAVDDGERHRSVQLGVGGLPELQAVRAAVRGQQAVTAAGDAGAGHHGSGDRARGRGLGGNRPGR
ncbi:Uncharacterised protein [Mycobacteroides abscessus subsp. massiliense]|nr:Uncharacterised protein [Mycobacteroides abscessus subsp. massiliense]